MCLLCIKVYSIFFKQMSYKHTELVAKTKLRNAFPTKESSTVGWGQTKAITVETAVPLGSRNKTLIQQHAYRGSVSKGNQVYLNVHGTWQSPGKTVLITTTKHLWTQNTSNSLACLKSQHLGDRGKWLSVLQATDWSIDWDCLKKIK